MENVTFRLKETQSKLTPANQKETLVYLFFSYGIKSITNKGNERYKPLKYSTGLKIKPHQWNNKTYRAKQTSNFDYISFNTVLDNIETTIKKLHRENPNSTPEQLKKLLSKELNPNKETAETMTLNKFIDKFINDIKTGEKKTPKGTNYKQGTIETYNSFNKSFQLFQTDSRKQIDFKDITIEFYNIYTAYLSDMKLAPNTIGKHIKILKKIMHEADKRKLHNNKEYTHEDFKTINNKVENIYLSETEIKKLYNLDLSNNIKLDIARDVFLVGCYTAQRFSDYSIINENNIKEYNNIKYVELIQKKTGEKVIIPIRTELNNILKKYNYNLPKTHQQKVNKLIKYISKIAEINEITTVKTTKGGLQMKKQVPKYEQITTHTARRSGATNMHLAKISTLDIMKITGHRTESSLLKYIKTSKQETAEKLNLHPYFNTMVAN